MSRAAEGRDRAGWLRDQGLHRLAVARARIQGREDAAGPAGPGGDQACGRAALQPPPDSHVLLWAVPHTSDFCYDRDQTLLGGVSSSGETLGQIPWSGPPGCS